MFEQVESWTLCVGFYHDTFCSKTSSWCKKSLKLVEWYAQTSRKWNICDVIKQNNLELENSDFEV